MVESVLQQIVSGPAPQLARLNVDQFHRMIELGILSEGRPIELIDGLLVNKDRRDAGGDPMIHGPRHASTIKLWQRLAPRLKDRKCHLQGQLPITLGNELEPEPDGAIIRGFEESYTQAHPTAADVLLVCEIADSSLDYDRSIKLSAYARAGIPVYWIVNLREPVVEVYTQPVPSRGDYVAKSRASRGEMLQIPVAADRSVELPAAELLLGP